VRVCWGPYVSDIWRVLAGFCWRVEIGQRHRTPGQRYGKRSSQHRQSRILLPYPCFFIRSAAPPQPRPLFFFPTAEALYTRPAIVPKGLRWPSPSRGPANKPTPMGCAQPWQRQRQKQTACECSAEAREKIPRQP
jgi:hypothetical protein